MKMLAIYNGTNKKFRHDGDEFQREAFAWWRAQSNKDSIAMADVRDGKVRTEIRGMPNLDVLAIFDHGTPRGLPRMRESYKNVKGLAETIAGVTSKITIILYACSCGRGWWWWKPKNKRNVQVMAGSYNPRDGYAVALAAELESRGVDVVVWAHLTAGHTTRNPHMVKVDNHFPICKVTRRRWVEPGAPKWKQWKADMKGPKRFTFWK